MKQVLVPFGEDDVATMIEECNFILQERIPGYEPVVADEHIVRDAHEQVVWWLENVSGVIVKDGKVHVPYIESKNDRYKLTPSMTAKYKKASALYLEPARDGVTSKQYLVMEYIRNIIETFLVYRAIAKK